jgi:hypothetical protein
MSQLLLPGSQFGSLKLESLGSRDLDLIQHQFGRIDTILEPWS